MRGRGCRTSAGLPRGFRNAAAGPGDTDSRRLACAQPRSRAPADPIAFALRPLRDVFAARAPSRWSPVRTQQAYSRCEFEFAECARGPAPRSRLATEKGRCRGAAGTAHAQDRGSRLWKRLSSRIEPLHRNAKRQGCSQAQLCTGGSLTRDRWISRCRRKRGNMAPYATSSDRVT